MDASFIKLLTTLLIISEEEKRDSISGLHIRRQQRGETAPILHSKNKSKNSLIDDSKAIATNSSINNIELYIKLASQCYHEGFQSHFNYLNECNSNSIALKKSFELRKRATKISSYNYNSRDGSIFRSTQTGIRSTTNNCSSKYFFNQFQTSDAIRSDYLNGRSGGDTNFLNNSMILNIRVDISNSDSSDDRRYRRKSKKSNDLTKHLNINEIMTTSNSFLNNNHSSIIDNYCEINGLVNNLNHLNLADSTSAGVNNLPKIVLTDFSTEEIAEEGNSTAEQTPTSCGESSRNSNVDVSSESELTNEQNAETNANHVLEDENCRVMRSNFLNIQDQSEEDFSFERPPLKD